MGRGVQRVGDRGHLAGDLKIVTVTYTRMHYLQVYSV